MIQTAGALKALRGVVLALVQTHPDKQALVRAVEAAFEGESALDLSARDDSDALAHAIEAHRADWLTMLRRLAAD